MLYLGFGLFLKMGTFRVTAARLLRVLIFYVLRYNKRISRIFSRILRISYRGGFRISFRIYVFPPKQAYVFFTNFVASGSWINDGTHVNLFSSNFVGNDSRSGSQFASNNASTRQLNQARRVTELELRGVGNSTSKKYRQYSVPILFPVVTPRGGKLPYLSPRSSSVVSTHPRNFRKSNITRLKIAF